MEDEDIEWCNLGIQNVRKRNFLKAEEFITKFIAAQPRAWDGFQNLGIIRYAEGRTEVALALYDHSIRLLKKEVESGYADKIFLRILKREKEAIVKEFSLDELLSIEGKEMKD